MCGCGCGTRRVGCASGCGGSTCGGGGGGGGGRRRAADGHAHLSRRAGRAGVELWLLLDGAQAGGSAFTVRFGEAAAAAALLAPNVLTCAVPEEAADGLTG
jgi:hypothetical protein